MVGRDSHSWRKGVLKSPGIAVMAAGLLSTGLIFPHVLPSRPAPSAGPDSRLARPLPVGEAGPGAWDRLDVSEYSRRARLRFDTIDGFSLKAYFYPAAGQTDKKVDRLIMVPDVYSKDFEALEPIIADFNRDFHVVLLIPRGHPPSDRDWIGRRRLVDDLATNPKTSAQFLNDYRSLIKLLDRTTALPGRKGRTCILAGKFHSTVLLLDEVQGVDCLVLLSPNPSFFERDLATKISDRVKVPVLMISDERTGFRLRPVEKRLASGRLTLFPMAGVGMKMLHRRPEILETIRSFLRKPAAAVVE